ncbi:hypothetical protein H112_00827 [Trichophyton rubrum D6]|uniref:Rhodopsin domain-containing protein n=3 Tax=Trichophyton TaxID=5550 RepID=F2SZG2_TRIRC|nr:uncharacterized protein TERG_07934 [Trichophyton rubrum CBS 118892]EZF27181.1 hypothetical protein H100_00825 [Trichophyton rubrum MR850]EZF46104.1 hypothetical protein H102_00817 [Trichophyton rubrum CBS 100081]EZF56824.1 hypothetical protein H103_00825 [Trichophyton rubrum CBS 288.86]EZF67549.1 hypothetical protein H104_00809 [Trichophyton rubrum CBS 289.86]EZF78212.1 hypothetical protein H105_00820 [Trichophyton soudanense CBS 452.61]EZF88869.1 hypothetical protein H110_00825 [Trichophy
MEVSWNLPTRLPLAVHIDEVILARKIGRNGLLISVWTLFAVTTLLLISRFAIRLRVHRQLFWDDILAGLAYIFLLCHNILATLAAPTIYLLLDLFTDNHGFMQPDILGKIDRLVKLVLSSNFLFRICIYLVKASLLALLWRLFRSLPKFRRAWLGIIVVTVIGFALSMILPPVACSDFSAREFICIAAILVLPLTCILVGCISPRQIKLAAIDIYVSTVFDVLTDVLIVSLPVAFVLKSSLPMPQKTGLIVLFLLGLAVVIISILRTIETDGKTKLSPPSWLLFWSSMEATIAVMVSCFASYKSLFSARSRPSTYHPHGHTASVVAPTPAEVRKTRILNESDSREEIIHRTEFEVSYEMAPAGSSNRANPYSIPSNKSLQAIPSSLA